MHATLCVQVQALMGNAPERLAGWAAGELGIKHPPSLLVRSWWFAARV